MPRNAGAWNPFALVLIDVQRDFFREQMSAPLSHYEKRERAPRELQD
jgi:hypothetical protein